MPCYKSYQPPASLRTIIRDLEIFHANWNDEQGLPAPFITCLANTEQNLYFYLNDPVKLAVGMNKEIPVPPVVITGPKYKPVGLIFGKDHLMIKIAFHPTGTYRLLGIDMPRTANNGIDATEFWGDDINVVLSQLRQAASYESMIELVCKFIEDRFDRACRPEEPIDKTAISMLDASKDLSLDEWASLACLSLRQFERNFTRRVGISPKLFIRIVRFEHAMKVKNADAGKTWSQIALECGYADSSHLLREFKEFAEFPPSRFYLQPTSGSSEFPTG